MELDAKRLELLHGVVPTTTIFGLLINSKNSNAETLSKDVQEAAKELGELGARALVIGADPLFNANSERLAALTLRYVMPSIFQYRPFAAAGGLMSYGDSSTEPFRQAGVYVGRILKGEKPPHRFFCGFCSVSD